MELAPVNGSPPPAWVVEEPATEELGADVDVSTVLVVTPEVVVAPLVVVVAPVVVVVPPVVVVVPAVVLVVDCEVVVVPPLVVVVSLTVLVVVPPLVVVVSLTVLVVVPPLVVVGCMPDRSAGLAEASGAAPRAASSSPASSTSQAVLRLCTRLSSMSNCLHLFRLLRFLRQPSLLPRATGGGAGRDGASSPTPGCSSASTPNTSGNR
jgi:hypothetical protein